MTAADRPAPPPGAPNIVLMVADDLGWADLGCYGSSFYETPRLDRLAGEGARFGSAYAAAPVCSPTRASLLSGKYPATVGVTQWIGGHAVGRLADVPYLHSLPMSEISLARALREGGYRTWHVGKWHLGTRQTWPDRHGFDVNIAGTEWGSPKNGYFSPYGISTLPDGPAGEYLTDRITDEAVRLITSATGEPGPGSGGAPFFLHLAHYAVHTPIQAPYGLVDKYECKAAQAGLDSVDPFEDGEYHPTWHLRHLRVRRRRMQSDPVYAAMVENLDTNIGRVLDALERAGQAANTIVIFTSDNGGLATSEGSPTCNAPLSEGKGWLADGGLREPLLIRWPDRLTAGAVIDEPVTSPDFYPTLLAAAGLEPRPAQHVDGVSFLSALLGRPFERGPIYWHYPHYSNQGGTPGAAVRDGDWKLVWYFEDDHVELYDIRADVGEAHDLTQDRGYADVRIRLRGLLEQWQHSVGALMPKPNAAHPTPGLPGGLELPAR